MRWRSKCNAGMRKRKRLQMSSIRCTLLYVTALATVAVAAHPKIADDLGPAKSDGSVDVIIQFQHAPTESHHSKVRRHGGEVKSTLHLFNAAAYSVPADSLNDLAGDPEVAYISPDRDLQGLLDYAGPTVGANLAHAYGWDAPGIGIAV